MATAYLVVEFEITLLVLRRRRHVLLGGEMGGARLDGIGGFFEGISGHDVGCVLR